MFRELSDLASLVKQAREFGGRMQQLNEELRNRRVTGSAGGDMVSVEVNGLLEVLRCRIQPSLLREEDRELVEDLVRAATNDALGKARQLYAGALDEMKSGLQIPPALDEAIAKLTGGSAPPQGGE